MLHRQRKIVRYEVRESSLENDKPRPVSLDAGTLAVLRRQSEQQLEDAAAWGEAWAGGDYVFTREDGAPWHPDRVRVHFQQVVKSVDVPRIRMHDCATPGPR
jgi:hypothetical protein